MAGQRVADDYKNKQNIMSLIKWEPFDELDRFFDERILPSFPKVGLDFAADVYEENGSIIAKMNLPGVKADEVEVSIEDGSLAVSGRREEEKEINEKNYYSKEIRRGSFSRSVRLPKAVESNEATAKIEDGMLVVTMPVIKGAESKSVKVSVA